MPNEGGVVLDNFEIITENGMTFSFFQELQQDFNLKDLKINRWSKTKYKIIKSSLDAKF